MRIIFKVLNILLVIGAVVSLIGVIGLISGGGKMFGATDSSSPLAGAGIMIALVYSLPTIASAVLTFLAAFAGLTGKSDMCGKLATIILIIVIINLVLSIFVGGLGSSIIQLLFYGFYFYLAKQPSNY